LLMAFILIAITYYRRREKSTKAESLKVPNPGTVFISNNSQKTNPTSTSPSYINGMNMFQQCVSNSIESDGATVSALTMSLASGRSPTTY
jgi:hypothetical protein